MSIILDGKSLADKIIEKLRVHTQNLTQKPKLAVILVGNNPASMLYVNNKQKKAEYIGFESIVLQLDENISEDNLLEQIYILNEDPQINAILVQLPLPEHINEHKIIDAIDPIKDVDGFTSYNFGWLAIGYNPYAIPCTPKGILRLLDEYKINLEGKNVTVIGRSNIVGKPLFLMLEKRNATVTLAHSKTTDLKSITSKADIVISAVGKSRLITSEYIKAGAVVIDVGINKTEDGLKGDVDFETVKDKASYITPVPKGVGPMTIAMLMENTLELYKIQQQLII